MNAVRLASVFALLALAQSPARADQITLANSTSVQARWEGEWQKTHPMNNQQAANLPRPTGTCTIVVSGRTATCR